MLRAIFYFDFLCGLTLGGDAAAWMGLVAGHSSGTVIEATTTPALLLKTIPARPVMPPWKKVESPITPTACFASQAGFLKSVDMPILAPMQTVMYSLYGRAT